MLKSLKSGTGLLPQSHFFKTISEQNANKQKQFLSFCKKYEILVNLTAVKLQMYLSLQKNLKF